MRKKLLSIAQRLERVLAPPTPRKCHFPDFNGEAIHEGDTIRHPSGQTATVVYDPERHPDTPWRARYSDDAITSSLSLQVNHKGRAVVV